MAKRKKRKKETGKLKKTSFQPFESEFAKKLTGALKGNERDIKSAKHHTESESESRISSASKNSGESFEDLFDLFTSIDEATIMESLEGLEEIKQTEKPDSKSEGNPAVLDREKEVGDGAPFHKRKDPKLVYNPKEARSISMGRDGYLPNKQSFQKGMGSSRGIHAERNSSRENQEGSNVAQKKSIDYKKQQDKNPSNKQITQKTTTHKKLSALANPNMPAFTGNKEAQGITKPKQISSATAAKTELKNKDLRQQELKRSKDNDNSNYARQKSRVKYDKYIKVMKKAFFAQRPKGKAITINIGLDLGTSYSKVVWEVGGKRRPVRFGGKENLSESYMLPSVVLLDQKGSLRINTPSTKKAGGKALMNFKTCLACESDSSDECNPTNCDRSNVEPGELHVNPAESASFLTSFYLARLLTISKKEILRELEELGMSKEKKQWMINLAVPDAYLDASEIADGFEGAMQTGFLMSLFFKDTSLKISKKQAGECFNAAAILKKELIELDESFDCFPYSEIGAEVASITQSQTSKEGLYAFVDVGAGTVDVSVFNFFRGDGEVNRPPFSADVYPLGAANIEIEARRDILDWLKAQKESIFQSETAREIETKQIKSLLIAKSKNIATKTKNSLQKTFSVGFKKYSNVEKWKNLLLIVGGGGASIPQYQDAATHAFTLNQMKPEIEPLPVPQDFDMGTLPESDFHRFAVAYGLSFSQVELPEMVRPSDVVPMRKLGKKIYIDPTDDG